MPSFTQQLLMERTEVNLEEGDRGWPTTGWSTLTRVVHQRVGPGGNGRDWQVLGVCLARLIGSGCAGHPGELKQHIQPAPHHWGQKQ